MTKWTCFWHGHDWDCNYSFACTGNHTCRRCGKSGPKHDLREAEQSDRDRYAEKWTVGIDPAYEQRIRDDERRRIAAEKDGYFPLSDEEWAWVEIGLDPKRGEKFTNALRAYLDDRIAERMFTARADERDRIAAAIEAQGGSYHQPSPSNLSHWFDVAAEIARNGGKKR